MVNQPSNSIFTKFKTAYSLAEPDELFISRLRQSLIQQIQESELKVKRTTIAEKEIKKGFFTRKAWVATGLVLLVIIITFIFRQPVLAAAGRLFGYGYFPQVGFIELDSAKILKSPIKQEHGDSSLTVISGLATPKATLLWLKFAKSDATAAGAWLETPSGERIDFSYWNYDANQTDLIRLEFPPLSNDTDLTTLMLPAGWQLPLTWIPASQSALPDVSVVQTSEEKSETDVVSATPLENCSEQNGVQICILAATDSGENTSILVKAVSSNPDMVPGGAFRGLAWTTEQDPVILRDENGVTYPLSEQHGDTLIFPKLNGGEQKVTLIIPAVIAKVNIPQQTVRVDMGDDPQPDQQIPVNADIQVLGSTIRFRKATFIGDGVSSLRLTMSAEPLETADGITPYMLEMSKPDRIDDMYGGGGLAGSKGLFVELIRPQGKITGVLELPIIQSTVIVAGPFEFSFSLSQFAMQSSPTPELANPDTFSPAPTPTPLALDTYQFTGLLPKSGDLMFTVVNRDTTSLYFSDPSNPSGIEQIARLPGQVYQVYLHPDGLGIDYLVGEQGIDIDTSYYRSAQLFTLRFADNLPCLLYTFPRGDGSIGGTEVIANWSFDGKLLAYQRFDIQPKPGETYRKIGWINLTCRETGDCQSQEFQLEKGLDLYNPQFSPQGYSLMLEGYNSASGSGMEDIFLINFAEQGTPGNIINLSDTDQIDEGSLSWNPKTDQVVALCLADITMAKKGFCFYDPISGERHTGEKIDLHNPQNFQISVKGDQIFIMDINNGTGRKGVMELHSIDFNGNVGPVLASKKWFDEFTVSANGNELAYYQDQRMGLNMLSISSGTLNSVYATNSVGAISWMGWVN